jgi:uncharacterized protein YdaU (DUF1376 family)
LNFYKHHLGDYDGATVHLTWDEDMAYTRLLRVYYRLEQPIPLEPAAAYRLVRATTKTQKEAVTRVLHEYFEERDDGWHNKRADEEIAAYQAQAETNRRIARQRSGNESSNDPSHGSSTKRGPNHEPQARTKSQEPEAINPRGKSVSAAARRAEKGEGGQAKSAAAWQAFTEAYVKRYGFEPTRNAVENAAMAAFCELVPLDEAPEIAAFYVRHPKAWYFEHQHSVKYLRQDAAGLRTQWQAGRQVTSSEARQAEQTAARGAQAERLIAETRNQT